MTDKLFLIGYVLMIFYSLWRLKVDKEHRAINGFTAGMFIVIFIYKSAPVISDLIMKWYWRS